MKGKRLVIPGSIRGEVLEKVHQRHQGITKCLERAQMSIWWPGITKQIKDKVSQCETCVKNSYSHPEHLLTNPLPSRPWQRVASDIFHWNKGNYVLLIDYYSRYIEVASLTSMATKPVIEKLKAMFARQGKPRGFSYGQWTTVCSIWLCWLRKGLWFPSCDQQPHDGHEPHEQPQNAILKVMGKQKEQSELLKHYWGKVRILTKHLWLTELHH